MTAPTQRPPWWPTKAQKERADKAHREAMARKATRYVVIVNIPGCSPETDPTEYEDYAEARGALETELAITADSLGLRDRGKLDQALAEIGTEIGPKVIQLGEYAHELAVRG